jgi:selenocysteine lyase/cysteine desulfurase
MGTIQPVAEIGRRCADKGGCLLVDTAQSAGLVPLDMTAWHVGAVAFTGHKALCGPTGIGGLVVHPDVDIRPTRFGGTGVDSKSLVHTPAYPHRLEAGTLNLMGIIGLSHGLDHIMAAGIESIFAREAGLTKRFCNGLRSIDGIRIFGEPEMAGHVGLATIAMPGKHPQDLADILDGDFGIAVRAGLHCAPLVHKAMGTYPDGAVRFSLGPFSTAVDIDAAIDAMTAIARF